MMEKLGAPAIPHHADYRLISRKVRDCLLPLPEQGLFLRCLIPSFGFPSQRVYYTRSVRSQGESKYPFKKMLHFALSGITGYSITPLRAAAVAGIFFSALSLLGAVWAFFIRFATDRALPGWTSIALPVMFLGGIQLLTLGVIGEYIGRIAQDARRRPQFLIETTIAVRKTI
jgi:hypothetical protein